MSNIKIGFFVFLLLSFGQALADTPILEAGLRIFESITLPDGRVCENCSITTKGGYINDVIHPEEGSWALAPGAKLVIKTDREYHGPDIVSPYEADIVNLKSNKEVESSLKQYEAGQLYIPRFMRPEKNSSL